jgi:hypothetical protein
MTAIRNVWMFCVAFAISCPAASAADGEDAIRQTLQAYEQAWSRHDAHAVAGFYFEPAMRVSMTGPVVRPTQTDQENFFDGYLRGLVGRGFDRSEWESLEVRLLDPQVITRLPLPRTDSAEVSIVVPVESTHTEAIDVTVTAAFEGVSLMKTTTVATIRNCCAAALFAQCTLSHESVLRST